MSQEQYTSSYRFAIILIVSLTSFLGNFTIFQMAGLAPQIIAAAALTPTKFGLIIGIAMLTAAVFGMPLGALGDRLGVKPVVGTAIAFTIVGCLGRYLANPTFGAYIFWMFLIGSTNAALNANFIKVLGIWLPSRNIGLGVGCYLSGIGLGQAISIASGSHFSSMGSAFFFAIVLSVVILALWLILVKNPSNFLKQNPKPVKETLKYVIKKKDIWIGGGGIFFMLGTYVTLNSFITSFLIESKGLELQSAGISGSSIALFMLIGGLLADRLANLIGNSRLFLFLVGILSAAGVMLVLKLDYGIITLLALSITGFSSGAYCSYILSLPMRLSYVGPVYAGSAGGLISSLQSGGAFILPSIFPIISGGSQSTIFMWIVIGFVIMGILALPLPQLVVKNKA